MPIYEYRCETCNSINSALILNSQDEQDLRCGNCDGDKLVWVLSRCVIHKTETQRLDDFDPLAPRGDDFYKDSRNVGLWAKKRMSQMGVDLGDHMNEVVEKARTGKILDE